MNFSVKEYNEYFEDEILNLYNSVGWINYTADRQMLMNSYANSLKILGAYKDGELIGIIRVVGDGYSVILIQDILVLPQYQNQGVGTALINEILNMYENVYQKILITDNTEKSIRFYKSAGFTMDADIDCRAFLKIN